jgi:elongation factor Ts
MAISTADITKLREMTGAGMMDCNTALKEADGNIDMAAEILRKKGVIKAAKRADKIVAEGTVVLKVAGNVAVVAEINSETDFVAKNEDFQALAQKIADHLVSQKPTNVEEALDQTMDGVTLKDYLVTAMAKIGEKISLRRFSVMEKSDADVFGAYSHMGGKIGALLVIQNSANEALARDIAMHVAAMNPEDTTVLLAQPFVKNPEITVGDLIIQNIGKIGENIQVGEFLRMEI